jgi:uncharacterized protein (TIGR01370 family)
MSGSNALAAALTLAQVALMAGGAAGCRAQLSLRGELAARIERAASWQVDHRCEALLGDDRLVVNNPDLPCAYAGRVRARGVWLAYLSVGEIHESLPCFVDLRREGAVLGKNPHWPGAHYVDVGHPAWRRRYLEPRLQLVARQGFHGVFLDTLDSAIDEPGARDRPAGARAAVLAAVRRIRALHPEWIIVPNGGLALDALAPLVDAWAIEDAFGGYDWAAGRYVDTSPARQAIVLPALLRLRHQGLPIFVLDYAAGHDVARRATLLARCRAEGLRCAIDALPAEVVSRGAPAP